MYVLYSVKEMPSGGGEGGPTPPPGSISFTQFKYTQLMKQRWKKRKEDNQPLL